MHSDVDHDRGEGDGESDAQEGPGHPGQEVDSVRFPDSDEEDDVHAEVEGRVGQTEADFELESFH